MAAISIVSGTSLNAFFHPCENLQSIAIQRAWRSASAELLSCIAKPVILPGGWQSGARPMSSLVTGMGEDGVKRSRGKGGLLLQWMRGQDVIFWGDLHWDLPSAPHQQKWHKQSGGSPGLWHSSTLCWKSLVIPTAVWLDSLYCQPKSKGGWHNPSIFWASLVW